MIAEKIVNQDGSLSLTEEMNKYIIQGEEAFPKMIESAIYKIRDKHVKTLYNLQPTDTSFINLYDEKYILLHQKLLAEFKTKRISNAILQETVIVK